MLRISLALFALLVFAGPASAAEKTAQEFLQSIYSQYHGDPKAGPGIMLDKPADYRRYFEPSLAKLMLTDAAAAAKRGDVPELDGDPFIDAQDWDIADLTVHIDSQTADTARATVKFRNFKEQKTIHLALVHTPEGWRIADVVWNGTDGTLRGLYVKTK
jgi:hypothetical protein